MVWAGDEWAIPWHSHCSHSTYCHRCSRGGGGAWSVFPVPLYQRRQFCLMWVPSLIVTLTKFLTCYSIKVYYFWVVMTKSLTWGCHSGCSSCPVSDWHWMLVFKGFGYDCIPLFHHYWPIKCLCIKNFQLWWNSLKVTALCGAIPCGCTLEGYIRGKLSCLIFIFLNLVLLQPGFIIPILQLCNLSQTSMQLISFHRLWQSSGQGGSLWCRF